MTRRMKDSDVDWIGEIPEDWEKIRLKFLCNINTGNKDTINRVENGEYPFFVRSPIVERIDSYSFDGEAILTAGDGAGTGKVFHYINGKFDYHQRVYNIHDFKGVNPKFLFHFLKTNFIKEIEKGTAKSTVESLRLPMLKNFPIVIPSLEYQKKIVEFLDVKVNQIDTLIENTKLSIRELNKYKQSLITESLTKGLNNNISMKDTGIDWIGYIPSHWDVRKLKNIFIIKKEIANSLGYDVLSVTQQGLKIKDIESNEGQLSSDYSKYQIVVKNDFVMNHMDLLTGWVDCSKHLGVTSPDYRVFRFRNNSEFNHEYYKYLLQACYLNKTFYGYGQGVSNFGRWRLPTDQFLNFYFPVPSLEEQNDIANFLDGKIKNINNLIFKKEQLVNEIEGYKNSLIYEYVTGKKEVL